MGVIELLLGQPTINAPGVTLVVRNNKAYLTKEPDLNEMMRRITLETESRRPKVLLAEDVTLRPDSFNEVRVEIENGVPGVRYFMGRKHFPCGESTIVIPAGLLEAPEQTIQVFNGGREPIEWRKGRIISRAEACMSDEEAATKSGTQVRKISVSKELDVSCVTVGNVSSACKAKLFKLLKDKANCFSSGDSDLGLTHLGEMRIQLKTDVPIYYRPYRLSHKERELVRDKVRTLSEAGVIRESESAYASPIVLIPKKSGEIRMCVDYRALNAITVKDRYPLPLISDQMNKLANKTLFTMLDLAQGFHQVPMHPGSIDKTAFITPDGHCEYLRVPFGLSNSPAVFQRIINKMLGELRHEEVLAYIDDLLIPSSSEAEGLRLLEMVLDLVEKAGVKLKLSKCLFLQDRIEYLGHEVSAGGIQPGRRKIQAVREFPVPQNVHQVRQFMGLASYFRKLFDFGEAFDRPY